MKALLVRRDEWLGGGAHRVAPGEPGNRLHSSGVFNRAPVGRSRDGYRPAGGSL
jgi:hypothetical protein